MARRLGDLTGPEVGAAGPASVVLQPIAALEHHGPHLPLSTDTLIADALVDALVDGSDDGVLVLPTLAYGLSSEHVWAPGTVTLSPGVLLGVLDDVASSVVRLGGHRLAFLNTHGGNTDLLRVAAREIRARHGLYCFVVMPMLPPDKGGPPSDQREEGLGIHGSAGETSLVCHLRPDLVHLEHARRAIPTFLSEYELVGLAGGAEVAWLSNDLGPEGVIGDPTLATAAEGTARFESAVSSVRAVLDEVRRFRFPGDG